MRNSRDQSTKCCGIVAAGYCPFGFRSSEISGPAGSSVQVKKTASNSLSLKKKKCDTSHSISFFLLHSKFMISPDILNYDIADIISLKLIIRSKYCSGIIFSDSAPSYINTVRTESPLGGLSLFTFSRTSCTTLKVILFLHFILQSCRFGVVKISAFQFTKSTFTAIIPVKNTLFIFLLHWFSYYFKEGLDVYTSY